MAWKSTVWPWLGYTYIGIYVAIQFGPFKSFQTLLARAKNHCFDSHLHTKVSYLSVHGPIWWDIMKSKNFWWYIWWAEGRAVGLGRQQHNVSGGTTLILIKFLSWHLRSVSCQPHLLCSRGPTSGGKPQQNDAILLLFTTSFGVET